MERSSSRARAQNPPYLPNVTFSKRADLENLIKVSEKEFGDVPDVYIAGAGGVRAGMYYVMYRRATLTICGSLGRTSGTTQKKMGMLKSTSI